MLYYNKVSKESMPLHSLCVAENTSIAAGLPFGQWVPVTQDPFPVDVAEGDVYDLGTIELRDGEAFHPWVKIAVTEYETPVPPVE